MLTGDGTECHNNSLTPKKKRKEDIYLVNSTSTKKNKWKKLQNKIKVEQKSPRVIVDLVIKKIA